MKEFPTGQSCVTVKILYSGQTFKVSSLVFHMVWFFPLLSSWPIPHLLPYPLRDVTVLSHISVCAATSLENQVSTDDPKYGLHVSFLMSPNKDMFHHWLSYSRLWQLPTECQCNSSFLPKHPHRLQIQPQSPPILCQRTATGGLFHKAQGAEDHCLLLFLSWFISFPIYFLLNGWSSSYATLPVL